MLAFPYQDEPLMGPPPPTLPPGALVRWRPLIPIDIIGPKSTRHYTRALLDCGADDTVFPLTAAARIGAVLQHTGHGVRWRGRPYPLQFAQVELLLQDGQHFWRWPTTVGFSPAPLRYPILGIGGCLQFFDVTLRGDQNLSELETNASYPGTKT